MRITKLSIAKALLVSLAFLTVSCNDDENHDGNQVDTTKKTSYFVGVEVASDPATEVLVSAENLTSGIISPENKGYAQPGWMFYMGVGNTIITADYFKNHTLNSYVFKDGKLEKGSSLSTNLQIFSKTFVDDNTLVLVASQWGTFNKQEIYIVNVDEMAITNSANIELENDETTNTSAMPNGVLVKGDKLFISFHNSAGDDGFAVALPAANTAKIAVYNYPSLTFDKIITDTRCPNVGRYTSSTVLQEDENGDIYTYATSSILSGYAPIPETNSGILRIKNGTTEFDKDYHIDFEEISNGYKINDLYYVANGKAVVRVVPEDESVMAASLEAMQTYAWAAYVSTAPVAQSPIFTGIIDLKTKSFKLLPDVPVSGGTFDSPVLIEGTKAYVGVSTAEYADIYIIDTEAGTATKGASIKGNNAKGIMKLTE